MNKQMKNEKMSARQSMGPKVGRPMMKQPTFNWDMEENTVNYKLQTRGK